MSPDRWALTLAGLLGKPWPMPPDLPGRACRGTYTGARAADLLRLQIEAQAAAQRGWQTQRPERRKGRTR